MDFQNISILSVDGIAFSVYLKILDALEIPWVLRTDNDVFKVPKSDPIKWNLAGLNRALKIAGENVYEYLEQNEKTDDLSAEWANEAKVLKPKGIYVSQKDLENDLGEALSEQIKEFSGSSTVEKAVEFLQDKKAIRMRKFLAQAAGSLRGLGSHGLAKPLHHAVKHVRSAEIIRELIDGMSDFEPTRDQLNAINHSGSMVVIAKPGSGKTFVVSEKIRNTLPSLPDHKGVIAISYKQSEQ